MSNVVGEEDWDDATEVMDLEDDIDTYEKNEETVYDDDGSDVDSLVDLQEELDDGNFWISMVLDFRETKYFNWWRWWWRGIWIV